MINTLRKILPHVCIVLSLFFAVLLILNIRNPFMGFLSSGISLWCLAAFCAVAFATGIVLAWMERREDSDDDK